MKGVLLVNLGSPDSPNPKDVKRYLGEFLMDERVIDLPYLLRTFLVKGIILNTRPKKSAKAYQKIWTDEGSPLIVFSEQLQAAVQQKINMPVALGMRYGSMSIAKGLDTLHKQGVTQVLLVPLYPQYAMSTTETVIEKTKADAQASFPNLHIDVLPPFYNNANYIDALHDSIVDGLNGQDIEHLLFSYHGVPERHIRKSDITKQHCLSNGQCCQQPSKAHQFCYKHQCVKTSEEVAVRLGLAKDQYTIAFQSRLGRDPWLQPYTAEVLEKMPAQGHKKLTVATPSFVSDCLETLEEMNMENREVFMESGGEAYTFIPCLNTHKKWVDALVEWSENWQNNTLQVDTL